MKELITDAVLWYNLPLTILFGAVVLYWIGVCFGALDMDTFDVDVDHDVHLETDAHADVDHDFEKEVHAEGSGGIFMGVLRFLNVGDVPFMLILSIFTVCLWTLSMTANHYLNPGASVIPALLILGGGVFVSGVVTKIVSTPFRAVMRKLRSEEERQEPIVGRAGRVTSTDVSAAFGQVEIATEGAPIIINARIHEGSARLVKDDECLVIEEEPTRGFYYVRKTRIETPEA
jgi:hypothetical protein